MARRRRRRASARREVCGRVGGKEVVACQAALKAEASRWERERSGGP